MLQRFLPQDERFYDYFREAANNATAVADGLVDLMTNFEDVERKVARLRDLERNGDEITHRVFDALNRTFVTPLDREDIRALTSDLDDFVDYIEEASKRIGLYHIAAPTEYAVGLARILAEQAQNLSAAIPLLQRLKDRDTIRSYIVEVNRLENEADSILHTALGQLYDGVIDIPGVINAIRWGELYQLLEDATDRGEDVANTLETIVLKNA